MKTAIPRSAEEISNDLHHLLLGELEDLLSAEQQQLTNALAQMAHAAESKGLADAFKCHLQKTREHVSRLEKVFASLNEPVGSKTYKAMKGLIEAGEELIEARRCSSALDAAFIGAAQKVDHYEISSYGCVRDWAEKMGHEEAVELLIATHDEHQMPTKIVRRSQSPVRSIRSS